MPLVIVMIVAIITAKWDEVDLLETLLGFDEFSLFSPFPVASGCWARSDFTQSPAAALGLQKGTL